jgi:hypothetical protein
MISSVISMITGGFSVLQDPETLRDQENDLR